MSNMQQDEYIFDNEDGFSQYHQSNPQSRYMTTNLDSQKITKIDKGQNQWHKYQENKRDLSGQQIRIQSNKPGRKDNSSLRNGERALNSIIQFKQSKKSSINREGVQQKTNLVTKKSPKSNLQQFLQAANQRVSRPQDLYEQAQYSDGQVKLQYSEEDMMIPQDQADQIVEKKQYRTHLASYDTQEHRTIDKQAYSQIRLQPITQEKQHDNISQEQQNSRKDGKKTSSLSDVTEQFIKLLKRSPNMTVCLNEAMKVLNLKKRRLYDISNVLQGIGYVKKSARNHVKWIGGGQDPIKAMQIHFLKIYEKKQADRQREVKLQKQSLRMQMKQLVERRAAATKNRQLRVSYEKLQAVRKAHGQNFIAIVFPMRQGQQFYFFDQKDENSMSRVVFQLERSPESHQYFYVLKPGQDLKKCTKLIDIS